MLLIDQVHTTISDLSSPSFKDLVSKRNDLIKVGKWESPRIVRTSRYLVYGISLVVCLLTVNWVTRVRSGNR